MEFNFPQFDTTKPFVTTSLVALRNEQRKMLLSIPDVTVKNARKNSADAGTIKSNAFFEGQLECVIREEAQDVIAGYDDASRKWLKDADQIEVSRKLAALIAEYTAKVGSSPTLNMLMNKHARIGERLIESPHPQTAFNLDPQLVNLISLLDLADWLADDGFHDPRALFLGKP
jgi:hypothetical protein